MAENRQERNAERVAIGGEPLRMILFNSHRLTLKQPATNDMVFPDVQDRDNRRRNFRRYLQARGGKPHHPDLRNTCHCRFCSAMRN